MRASTLRSESLLKMLEIVRVIPFKESGGTSGSPGVSALLQDSTLELCPFVCFVPLELEWVAAGSVEDTRAERRVPARLLGAARREGNILLPRDVGDVGPGICDVGLPIWDAGDIDLVAAADTG